MTHSQTTPAIAFDNSYARLPEGFFAKVHPAKVSNPEWLQFNSALAEELGLDPVALKSDAGLSMLAGNDISMGSEPIAMAYAGHQFGNWVAQLGDGRAVLLGEFIDKHGQRHDIQLKGAGRTPFSRGGDGRNWIGPVLREYLISEAMAALQVPTTRALAAVSTGDRVLRENGPMPGAILTRVAHSHVRVGTFQFFAARQNIEAIATLMNYVIDRHYPQLSNSEDKAMDFLKAVIQKQATLVAHWQSLGFIHGVMNTDNCSIVGLTIDYGPCAFMDTYQADKVFSSIDYGSRYAYQNQPRVAQWNLANLAQCLLPLITDDQEQAVAQAQEAIDNFTDIYRQNYAIFMRAKLGLIDEKNDDLQLISTLLDSMQLHHLDFTATFTAIGTAIGTANGTANGTAIGTANGTALEETEHNLLFSNGAPLHEWRRQWLDRLSGSSIAATTARECMQQANPAVIPRNHLVEEFIDKAISHNDLSAFEAMLQVVQTPFDATHKTSRFAIPPADNQIVTQTFCGT